MSDNDYFSYEARQARRARRLASFDGIDKIGESRTGKLTTQNAGQYAIQMAREVLDNFILPSMPRLSYSGIRNAKTAQSSTKLEDGVITIFAELRTSSNIMTGFDIPMEIRAGELMEPSVVVIDGAPRIIAQSTFDDLMSRNTIYEQPPVRELYAPPLSAQSAKELYGNRLKQKKINTGLFSIGANKQALKDALSGKDAQLMEEAQQKAPAPKEYVPGRHPVTQPIPKLKGPLQYGQTYNDDTTNLELPNTHVPNQQMPVDEPMRQDPTRSLRPPPKMPAQKDEYPWTQDATAPVKVGAVEDYDADDKHEKPEPDRNQQDEDWLDPAERSTADLCAGQKATIKQPLELKDRGGGAYDISKGTSCLIVRDHAGDNKSFVIRLDDGMEAIVERCYLSKSGQYIPAPEDGMPTIEKQKQDMQTNQPVSLVADMDFMAKVTTEVQGMAEQGISEIDAKSAIFKKYGPEVAAQIFE